MILQGDCLTYLRTLPADSVDAIVTDPPYGLSKEPDMAEVVRHWLAGDDYKHKGPGFMGKSWDSFVPGPAIWVECLRVLKPGGHMVAFFGTRTYDMGTLAVRLAGFEIRDQLAWVFGSGFPKSLDVSKAIDKARVEDLEPTRQVCRAVRAAMDARGLKSRDLVHLFGGCHPRLVDHWAARDTDSQPAIPRPEQWPVLRDALGMGAEWDGQVAQLNARKGLHGDAWSTAEVTGEYDDVPPGLVGRQFTARDNKIRKPSDRAEQWAGWGTALKPAYEPIVLARKPLEGTVAANVLAHGTGGLNIDAGRVGGRWPANLAHDGGDDVAELLGPAARFFYCAKASKSDRNEGLGGLADVVLARSCQAQAEAKRGNTVEREGGAYNKARIVKNNHPTVKPTDLMRWLCRLVAPPGGLVLDPFAGSGSTGKAAVLEGFNFIGMEQDPGYCDIARARIAAVSK